MSDYKRLTDKEHRYKKCASCTYGNCQYCDDIYDIEKEALNRLAELEDKIENGTLIELPCKVGDTVWFIMTHDKFIYIDIIRTIEIGKFSIFVNGVEFGKTVFLTKAEAEKKLEELKGGAK